MFICLHTHTDVRVRKKSYPTVTVTDIQCLLYKRQIRLASLPLKLIEIHLATRVLSCLGGCFQTNLIYSKRLRLECINSDFISINNVIVLYKDRQFKILYTKLQNSLLDTKWADQAEHVDGVSSRSVTVESPSKNRHLIKPSNKWTDFCKNPAKSTIKYTNMRWCA